MSYKEMKGNLITLAKEGKFQLIAHGCNCQKTMGAGLAFAITKQLPEARTADKDDTRKPLQRLGDMTIAQSKNVAIANLYTQFLPGKDLSYSALSLSLQKLNHKYADRDYKIGLPLIGCGIAGGEWSKVKKIIKREMKDCDVTVVVLPEQWASIQPWWKFW